jgi:lipopolysaccharide transport system permease protein
MLGAVWNVLNPLAMIVVYTMIFSKVMHARLLTTGHSFSYSIYLCAGTLIWGLFAEISGRMQSVFIDHANLLKKIHFPRLCLPASVVCSAMLNFSIVFSLFSLFLLLSGNFPGWPYLALLPVLLALLLFASGLGVTLGVLNVFFRDVGPLFGILLQFWFWATPIVYPANILPIKLLTYLPYNPMAGVVAACQTILVRGAWPHWADLLPVCLWGLLLSGLGWRLFRRHSAEIVDEL